MAHRNNELFIWCQPIRQCICRFCGVICSRNSAARHANICWRYVRFCNARRAQEQVCEDENRRAQRLARLQRQLETDIDEIPAIPGESRACVLRVGRYLDPLQVVESDQIRLQLTIRSIFRQRLNGGFLREVEETVRDYLPSTYVRN